MTIARKPEDTDHLRTSLPQAEADRWRPHLEDITMALGHVSYESGSKPAYVYFPTTAAILKSDLSDLRKVKIESF